MSDIELFLKASPDGKSLGDCPFCHKAFMALKLKNIAVEEVYIDLKNKPEWFLALNPAGTTPVLRQGELVLTESEDIVDFADEREPKGQLSSTEEAKSVGSSILGKMKALFLNKEPDQEERLRNDVDSVFKEINTHLESSGTEYLSGNAPTRADCSLLPKLYHAVTVLGSDNNYTVPQDLHAVNAYLERGFSHPAFQSTSYPKDYVLHGWRSKKIA